MNSPFAEYYALADTLDLAECPFCAGSPVIPYRISDDRDEGRDDVTWVIWCQACGADGPLAYTPEEAATLWNNRP